jgi:hypothetical protein
VVTTAPNLPTVFELRWPVVDPEQPVADLIAEALGYLKHELPILGLVPLSAPVFSWITDLKLHRHAGPFLMARLAVRDVYRRPDEGEA